MGRLVPFFQRLLHRDEGRDFGGVIIQPDTNDSLRGCSVLDTDQAVIIQVKPVDAAKMGIGCIFNCGDGAGICINYKKTGQIISNENSAIFFVERDTLQVDY